MEKRREFTRNTVEVCRNCKADGKVEVEMFNGHSHEEVPCPVCGGSGLVRKHIEGYVTIKPYTKLAKA